MLAINPQDFDAVSAMLISLVQQRCKLDPKPGLYIGKRTSIEVLGVTEDERGRVTIEARDDSGPRFYKPAQWRSLTFQPVLKDMDWHGFRGSLARRINDGTMVGLRLKHGNAHSITIDAYQRDVYEYQAPLSAVPSMLLTIAQSLLSPDEQDPALGVLINVHNDLLGIASGHVNLAR